MDPLRPWLNNEPEPQSSDRTDVLPNQRGAAAEDMQTRPAPPSGMTINEPTGAMPDAAPRTSGSGIVINEPSATGSVSRSASGNLVKAAPTKFHEAGQQAPELSWSQAMEGAGKSLLPSAGQGFGAMVSAVSHPIDTATSLGKLGQGALSKTAGWLGVKQDEKQKSDTEGSFNALLNRYKNVYGSTKGFKQALATDPFGILMDATTVASLGTLAPETATGRALSLVSKLDPVQAAVNVAGKLTKVPVGVLRHTQSGLSGVDYNALKMAHEVGEIGTASQRAGYNAAIAGKYDAGRISDRLGSAVEAARYENSAEYLSGKTNLVKSTPEYSGIHNEINAQRNNIQQSSGARVGFQTTHDAIDEAERLVQDVQGGKPTILDQDTLKRALYDLRNTVPSGAPRNAVDAISASVKKSIVDMDPKYADLMDAYQKGLTAIKEFKGELGAGANVGDAKVLARALKSLKTDAKTDVLKRLAVHDPDLPYILAGYAAKDSFRGGLAGTAEAMASLGLWPLIHPVAAVGSLAMGSPKLSSKSQYLLGRAGKLGEVATSKPVTSGLYYGQRGLEENQLSGSTAEAPNALLPRNVRNNNPGNITDSDFAKRQPGYVGSDGQFAVFDSPESGYSAHKTLLSSYGSEGRDTIDAIIGKWSPSEGKGNTPEVTNNYKLEVAKRLGVGIHDRLDMSNPNVLDELSKAMANFEGDKRAATGGRIGRASGGRIMNHRSEAENLIRLADKTKKALNNSTESLLAVPDEAVTKALSIANEAI